MHRLQTSCNDVADVRKYARDTILNLHDVANKIQNIILFLQGKKGNVHPGIFVDVNKNPTSKT